MIARLYKVNYPTLNIYITPLTTPRWLSTEECISELKIWGNPTLKNANAALRRNRMRRREKWQKTDWGWQAKVRWIER